MADEMWMSELLGRLEILGIPQEISKKLKIPQVRGIHATLGEWLDQVGTSLDPVPPG